jgi:hypothetical protein
VKTDATPGHKILKKPGPRVKSTVPKDIVCQFQPRATLKNTIKARTQPVRGCARAAHPNREEERPTHDICNQTPSEGFENNKLGFEPLNIREARAHITWPAWKAAMEKEVKGLLARGTWIEVHRSQVPSGVKIMG